MARSSGIAVGKRAEKRAHGHLLSLGLETVAVNFRCRLGEIDLIMLDCECLVFVEVRYRRQGRFASAAVSVDGIKQHKIMRAAAAFLAANTRFASHPVRFDVVAIDKTHDDRCTLQWIKDAFRPEG